MSGGRKIFIGESDHSGLVPDQAGIGDLLCVLFGCNVLLTLPKELAITISLSANPKSMQSCKGKLLRYLRKVKCHRKSLNYTEVRLPTYTTRIETLWNIKLLYYCGPTDTISN